MAQLQRIINHYIEYFKEEKDLIGRNIEEVEEILDSKKYSELINEIYRYYNSLTLSEDKEKGRLPVEYYLDADDAINRFWVQFLGDNLNEAMRSKLKL
jgi:hypothetical protein